MVSLNPQQLVQLIRDGNYNAFRQLFDAFYPRLLNYASHFLTDRDEAEDVAQGVFVRLWEGHALLTDVSLQSMLFTMTRNACLNVLKHQVVRGRFEAAYAQGLADSERLYNFDFYNDADHALLMDELRQQADAVMASLPERTQEVFRLSRQEGLKNREIAERLDISVKVVERHIGRALAAYREAFGAQTYLVLVLLALYGA